MYEFDEKGRNITLGCSLSSLESEELYQRLEELLVELSPVVQPLSADLELRCRTASTDEFGWYDFVKGMHPPNPGFSIQETSIPAGVKIAKRLPSSTTLVTQLDGGTFRHWLMRCMDQSLPNSEYRTTLYTLRFSETRARLLDESQWDVQKDFPLRAENGTECWFPIEQRKDGLWVSGPYEGPIMYPPIELEINTGLSAHFLDFTLYSHWSLWNESGTLEHKALVQVLQRLIHKSWSPEYVDPSFTL